MAPELEKLPFASAPALRAWLEANHDTSPGIWVMIAKKGSGVDSVTYDEAVDEGLCFGWIDSQKARHDETYFLQRFTPRTKRSPWSRTNTERVGRLLRAKRMQPAGAREVAAAKADGRWEAAYAGQATAAVPDDLQEALDASPAAAALFAELDGRNRYAILYRIASVKKAETRAKKIAGFVADLEVGVTPYPLRQEEGSNP
ncbi:MAG: YdeI/OmpD-associated family protein [Acidobacteria bacterium]|nr:YdeI/OmpD-associated family protein [Acidobacteriota bacterium]